MPTLGLVGFGGGVGFALALVVGVALAVAVALVVGAGGGVVSGGFATVPTSCAGGLSGCRGGSATMPTG